MPPKYYTVKANGHLFFFTYEKDYPDLLHIFARHTREPADAIGLFFGGAITTWNEQCQRFETTDFVETIYWIWLDQAKKKVLIISCFRN